MDRLNIYKRKDGRFEGRIHKETTNQGKRCYKYFFGYSKKEVKNKMKKYLNDSSKKTDLVSMCFTELYNEWINANRHKIKESTAANYEMKAEKHLIPAFGNTLISEITSHDIIKFISRKQSDRLSNRYISDILIVLKAVFKYGVLKYRIINPADGITMPKKRRSEVRMLSDEEQKELETFINLSHSLTTLAIALARYTGLRIGELCALQWKDIDFEKRILTVRKTLQRIRCRKGGKRTRIIITDPKSESSVRTIPIPDFLISFLLEFKTKAEAFVISGKDKPVEPRTVQYRFAAVLKNVKLPSVHFHSLRHSFATACIDLGFDVKALSELLGHSSVEITLNRYVHSSFEKKTEYMNRLTAGFS